MDPLERLKEAYQEAKKQVSAESQLSDICINTQTGEFTFNWETQDKGSKE